MFLLIVVILVLVYIKGQQSKRLVPKTIHKIYIQHDNTFGNLSSEIREAHNTWKTQNPDYEIKYYNGNDCRQYLVKHFTPKHVQTYDNILAYAGKCNFMRACIIYNEGGWYTDWKTVCLKPLDNLVTKHTEWVSAYDERRLFKQYKRTFMMTNFFGSIKKHPLLKKYIDNIIHNTETKHYGELPLDTTGPGVFGKSYDAIVSKENMLIGQYSNNHTYFYGTKWIVGKCDACTKGQNWKHGNNYNDLWKSKTYYKNN